MTTQIQHTHDHGQVPHTHRHLENAHGHANDGQAIGTVTSDRPNLTAANRGKRLVRQTHVHFSILGWEMTLVRPANSPGDTDIVAGLDDREVNIGRVPSVGSAAQTVTGQTFALRTDLDRPTKFLMPASLGQAAMVLSKLSLLAHDRDKPPVPPPQERAA